MKPKSFDDLPGVIQERLLWDIDLDYDAYESSMADTVHSIMNGNSSERNKRKIDEYYKTFHVDNLLTYAKQELDTANRTANSLIQLVRDCA